MAVYADMGRMPIDHAMVKLEQLRRLDEWLSHLTVWRQLLLIVPFAFVITGIAVGLNSVLPPVDPNLLFPARPFGTLPWPSRSRFLAHHQVVTQRDWSDKIVS